MSTNHASPTLCTCDPSLYSCGCGELHTVAITGTPYHYRWQHWARRCLPEPEDFHAEVAEFRFSGSWEVQWASRVPVDGRAHVDDLLAADWDIVRADAVYPESVLMRRRVKR